MPSCPWTFARRRAQRQTYPCWRAGLPKTSACGGTSRVTTDPAPIDAPYFSSVGMISQSSALLSLPSGVMAPRCACPPQYVHRLTLRRWDARKTMALSSYWLLTIQSAALIEMPFFNEDYSWLVNSRLPPTPPHAQRVRHG